MSYLTDKIAIVLGKPKVYRDTSKRLHREDGLAVEWKENDGFYYLHGVKFEKDLWEKVVGQKLTFKQIMAIEDIDQRWVALKFLDAEKLLKATKAELLDKVRKRVTSFILLRIYSLQLKTPTFLNMFVPLPAEFIFLGQPPMWEKAKMLMLVWVGSII